MTRLAALLELSVMKKILRSRSDLTVVLLAFAVASLLTVVTYPEIFITFQISFLQWSDICCEYILNFVLLRSFYQGGVQLWDYFGQMPLTYTYATFGLFHFQNLVTSLLYIVAAPFFERSAELYHHVFAWANLLSSLALRLSGIFLVLRAISIPRWILIPATILFAVFFSAPAFAWGTFHMSFFPIFMYFILRFAQTVQLRFLIATALFFLICLSNGIIHTGYLYIGMHFFVISCLAWSVLYNREAWRACLERVKLSSKKRIISAIAVIGLAAAVLAGPYAYIIRFCLGDIAFGAENSRIHQMFNPDFYFRTLELHLGDPRFFFKDTLDFLSTDYHFLGWTLWFLAICGLVLSRNRIKWLFLWAIVFLWLINHPRDHVNIGTVAHWINFLTNPLKSLCRAYYIGTYTMLPYLLMPLAALGIEGLRALEDHDVHARKSWTVIGVLTVWFAAITWPYLPPAPKFYLIGYTIFLTVVVTWAALRYSPFIKITLMCLLVLGTLTDIGLTVDKIKKHNALHYQIKPVDLQVTAQSGPVITEFENPKVTPLREFQTTDFFFKDETYLWFPQGLGNNFSNMTNPILNFLFLNGHTPRHFEFREWPNDTEMLNYVRQNKSTFWVAAVAVNAQPGTLGQIINAGLTHDVVMIDDPLAGHRLSDRWPDGLRPSQEPAVKATTFSGTIQQLQWSPKNELAFFTVRLPQEFPHHLTSSWFADHQRFLRLSLPSPGEKPVFLNETQGRLIKPYTFDVQNIQEGTLQAALPADEQFLNERFVLEYPSTERDGVYHVGLMTNDKIGFDYRAVRDGWFVMHYPYDPKWKITLDGRVIQYYRANKSFIAFPITKGDRSILIEYWPHSYLREWLAVSALTATIGMPLLIAFGLRYEKNNNPL